MFANSDELLKYVKDEGVEMIDVRFCDLPGIMQHFTVPVSSFGQGVFDDGLKKLVADMAHHLFCIPGKQARRFLAAPSANAHQPTRRREVVQRDHRLDTVREAGVTDIPVVIERGLVENAALRLDPCPLDREAIAPDAELGQHRDVALVPVPMIERRTGSLNERRTGNRER